jgi:D-proline reductase (dithiol) PrdB
MATRKKVDSYRFLSRPTRKLVRSWIGREHPRLIPWAPLKKPLSECVVAVFSTAGISCKQDRAFDMEGERQNPWWGDPSFRAIPNTATEQDVRINHLHVDTSYAERDLDCIFPLRRLLEFEHGGEVGRSAPSHYSIMGYILDPRVLLSETMPSIIRRLKDESVDAVVLIPM